MVMFVFAFMIAEVIVAFNKGLSVHFSSAWVWVDMVNYLAFMFGFAAGGLSLMIESEVAEQLEELTQPSSVNDEVQFVDLMRNAFWLIQAANVMSANGLIVWFKSFKYLNIIFPHMNLLVRTLSLSVKALVSVIGVFVVVMLSNGMAFNMSFGTRLRGYRSIGGAIEQCFIAVLGVFDYYELEQASPIMAPLVFCTNLVFTFFFLFNIMISVLSECYMDAQSELASTLTNDGPIKILRTTVKAIFDDSWLGQKLVDAEEKATGNWVVPPSQKKGLLYKRALKKAQNPQKDTLNAQMQAVQMESLDVTAVDRHSLQDHAGTALVPYRGPHPPVLQLVHMPVAKQEDFLLRFNNTQWRTHLLEVRLPPPAPPMVVEEEEEEVMDCSPILVPRVNRLEQQVQQLTERFDVIDMRLDRLRVKQTASHMFIKE